MIRDKFKNGFFWGEILLFLAAQILGLLCGYRIFGLIGQAIRHTDSQPVNGIGFLAGFFIAAAASFFLIRKIKKSKPFVVFFYFILFYGSLLTFSAWLPDLSAVFLAFWVVLIFHHYPRVFVQDMAIILSVAGIGAILGINIVPWQAAAILAVLSAYDFIAVYKTKHMVEMFKGLMEKGIIMAIVIPSRVKGFLADTKGTGPGGEFIFLGTGDLAFPIVLSVSALRYGILSSVLVIIGATLGVIFLYFALAAKKDRRPAPALPPIAAGAILGLLISLLFA